jgi:hypothetical protein
MRTYIDCLHQSHVLWETGSVSVSTVMLSQPPQSCFVNLWSHALPMSTVCFVNLSSQSRSCEYLPYLCASMFYHDTENLHIHSHTCIHMQVPALAEALLIHQGACPAPLTHVLRGTTDSSALASPHRCACSLCALACMHICMCLFCVLAYVPIHVCMCTYLYIYMYGTYLHMCVCVRTCTCMYAYAPIHVCMRTHLHMCVCIQCVYFVCMHMCMYLMQPSCIRTVHTHTWVLTHTQYNNFSG